MARTSSDIGKRIEARRERRGMTQAQLAEAAHLHQSQVSRFERGDRLPSIEQATAIASALGCSVAALLPTAPRAA
jgi:transcriptional regulator with XRE-family HTH domain